MKKPISKRWGLWIIVLVVILGIIGIVIGSNEPTDQTSPSATATATATATVEPTIEPSIEPTTEPGTEPSAEPTGKPSVEPTPMPSVAPTASDSASSESWDSSIKRIAKSDSTATEKADAVEALARAYKPSELELLDFNSSIVEEYTSQNYLANLEDAEYMLTNIFKAVVVQNNHKDGEPIKDFALDFYQNTKYTFRGAETPDSDAIKANEEQMNKALKKITK